MKTKNTWTQFMDMHSGGGQKEKFAYCYIEAPEREAKIIFYNRFGHNPERVTCTCCGSDYSITESESLEQATGYERNCKGAYFKDGKRVETWGEGHEFKYIDEPDREYKNNGRCLSLDKYVKLRSVLVIYDKDITPAERHGELPEQGYVLK